MFCFFFFFFKQKTAYEMRISDWSSDVCSSDLQFTTIAIERRHPPQLEAVGFCAAIYQATNPSSVRADSKRGQDAAGSKYTPNWNNIYQLQLVVAISDSEERRVVKESTRTSRSRWAQYHLNKTADIQHYHKRNT